MSEVQELEQDLPVTCRVEFDDPNSLHLFSLIVHPGEGFWMGGHYKFHIEVPDDYNIIVS